MQNLNTLFLITIGVIATLVGDVFLKKSQMINWWLFAAGILFYALGVVPVAMVFKKIEFGSVFLIWEAATVIAALFVAYFFFHEGFNVYKGLALLFALCALYFSYK